MFSALPSAHYVQRHPTRPIEQTRGGPRFAKTHNSTPGTAVKSPSPKASPNVHGSFPCATPNRGTFAHPPGQFTRAGNAHPNMRPHLKNALTLLPWSLHERSENVECGQPSVPKTCLAIVWPIFGKKTSMKRNRRTQLPLGPDFNDNAPMLPLGPYTAPVRPVHSSRSARTPARPGLHYAV